MGEKDRTISPFFCWSQCCLSYFSFRLCCKRKTLSNANAVRAVGRRKKVFHSISYLLSFFPIGCVCCRLLRRLCRLKRSGAYVLVSVDLWSHRLLHFLFPIPNSTDSLKHHNSQASRSVSVPYWELIDFSARVHSKSGSFFFTPSRFEDEISCVMGDLNIFRCVGLSYFWERVVGRKVCPVWNPSQTFEWKGGKKQRLYIFAHKCRLRFCAIHQFKLLLFNVWNVRLCTRVASRWFCGPCNL